MDELVFGVIVCGGCRVESDVVYYAFGVRIEGDVGPRYKSVGL